MDEFFAFGIITDIGESSVTISIRNVFHYKGYRNRELDSLEGKIIEFIINKDDIFSQDIERFKMSKFKVKYAPIKKIHFVGSIFSDKQGKNYELKMICKKPKEGIAKLVNINDEYAMARDNENHDIYIPKCSVMGSGIPSDGVSLIDCLSPNSKVKYRGYDKDNKLIIAICVTEH